MTHRAWRSIACLSFTLPALACADVPSMSDGADSQTETTGDGDGDGDGDAEALRPNWHEDVAPLVYENCVGCHFEGGIGPFALETYEQAAPFAALMNDATANGTMPPWGAIETDECQPPHTWLNDMRLDDAEKQLLADWAAAGAPEGDPNLAAPLPEPPSLELENPSIVLQNPSPYTVSGNQDSFVCMVVDPGHQQEVWITGIQMIADNTEVVHHVLTYIDTTSHSDQLIDADGKFSCPGGFVSFSGATQISTWVPGGVPTEAPPDIGFHMPVGAKIIMAYHYHPTGGGDEVDQSSIALRWTEEPPGTKAFMSVIGLIFDDDGIDPGPDDPNGIPMFEIPPDVAGHTESITYQLPDVLPPIPLFTMGTHMHYVGVDMKITVERDGVEQCWIQTPSWNFNWQRLYDVDAPLESMPTVQGGDIIKLRCTYDNTLNNPFLAEVLEQQGLTEPIPVTVGESSLDEMCAMLFGVATNLPIEEYF